MGQFQLKKSDLMLKFALFDSKSQNLQIRQWVALFKILPYLSQFLENFSLPYLEYPLYTLLVKKNRKKIREYRYSPPIRSDRILFHRELFFCLERENLRPRSFSTQSRKNCAGGCWRPDRRVFERPWALDCETVAAPGSRPGFSAQN